MEPSILCEITERCRRVVGKNLVSVVLFGSVARGVQDSTSEQYNQEDAKAAIEKARFVFETITLVLKAKCGLETEKMNGKKEKKEVEEGQ